MLEIKRYSFDPWNHLHDFGEDQDGEWVRWEDVKYIVDGIVLKADPVKCNCEEMSRKRSFNSTFDFGNQGKRNWICPAHGYKKL